MNEYDLAHYQEVDQEFVESVSKMSETDQVVLSLQDMDGGQLYEEDGSPVDVPLDKRDCDLILSIMRDRALTFEEAIVHVLTHAMNLERGDNN